MLIAIVLVFGCAVGLGHALQIYYEIKHDRERKERDAAEARARAGRRIIL